MPKFRKKPFEVDAIQYTGDNEIAVMDWARQGADPNVELGVWLGENSGKPYVITMRDVYIPVDDWMWIIREPTAPHRFYPLHAVELEATCDPAPVEEVTDDV